MEAIHVPHPEGRIDFATVTKVAVILDRENHLVSTTYFHESDDADFIEGLVEVQNALGHQVMIYDRQ
jgi:hypothetical protein